MSSKALVYLVCSILTFGLVHVTDKIGINRGVDPFIFSFVRGGIATLIIACIWVKSDDISLLRSKRHVLKNLIIIGIGASGIVVLLGIFAMSYTTATNKGVMQGMYMAVTMIFAYIMIHERLPKLFAPVLLTMIVGLVLLTTKGRLVLPNTGDWLLFLTIPVIGFCNAYAKKTMSGVQALTVSFGRLFFGTLFLLCFLPFITWSNLKTLSLGLVWLILSGALSAVYIVTFYEGVEIVGPTLSAAMLSLAPAVTALAEFFCLGERFTAVQLLGMSLILGSAVILTKLQARYHLSQKLSTEPE